MISKTELLKVAARSAYYIMSRALGFAALGLLLNLCFLPALWPEIKRFVFIPNLPHASGPAAALALAIMLFYALPGILMSAAFVIGFPVGYFLLGGALVGAIPLGVMFGKDEPRRGKAH